MTDRWRQDPEVAGSDLVGSHDVQVATGVSSEDGSVVVLVRFGRVLAVLTPEAANGLGDALKVEAAVASNTRNRRVWEDWKHGD